MHRVAEITAVAAVHANGLDRAHAERLEVFLIPKPEWQHFDFLQVFADGNLDALLQPRLEVCQAGAGVGLSRLEKLEKASDALSRVTLADEQLPEVENDIRLPRKRRRERAENCVDFLVGRLHGANERQMRTVRNKN